MTKIFYVLLFLLAVCNVQGQVNIQSVKPLQLFQPLIDKGEIAGVVALLATKDGIVSLEAAGYSDLEKKTPMKKDDIFWIASQTKPMVAFAFMMLLEEKNISLDDTLYNYIKEFKNQKVEVVIDDHVSVLRPPRRPVTFRMLLNHTSGLPAEPPVEKGPYDRVLLEDIMPGYAYTHLVQDPGEKAIYSSMGINTIGRMIEILSGMKFADFLQSRIFDPLGMKNTTFIPTEQQVGRLVTAYMKDKDSLKPVKPGFTQPLTDKNRVAQPFGGLFSTAEDLSRFCRMCLNRGELNGKRYLSEKSMDSMLVRRSVSPFGVGWNLYKNGVYGHSGAYNTDMTIFPGLNLVCITMVQIPSLFECRNILREAILKMEDKSVK